jgi:hypothetical protein
VQLRETEAMDSKPLTCLPRGSIVTVMKTTVSDQCDILSRRVLVKHVSEGKGKATEGWASVQSSQGYVILSPLVSLCYDHTRWGSTRPIVRQCGHAAHLKCVETHTLSLHQRAAGEQPYDGRFAANIDDGEFLCPLCKQLSNILIPRDGCARDRGAEDRESASIVPAAETIDRGHSLRNLLTNGTMLTKENIESINEIGQKALTDYGAHLLQAMDVPWERTTGARKRKHRRWHPAIQRWDYEEEDDDLLTLNSGASVKSVLRLLRQQHIAWAAVGHSAAAAEASSRGIEEVLPFGAFAKTDDPWSGYAESKSKDPMLLELMRTLTGASGLLEVLVFEMARQLTQGDLILRHNEVSVAGKCLADILEGKTWFLDAADGVDQSPDVRDGVILWSQLTALMASTPCHVARDGMISQRHEARAAAAAMWTVRGGGTEIKNGGELPVPLALDRIYTSNSPRPPDIPSNWGTMSPSAPADIDNDLSRKASTPFRPAVASAFLYIPLLAWDFNTLAGAVFSSMLLNDTNSLPSSSDLLYTAHLLLIGRMVQAMITPHGFDSPDDMEVDEEDDEGRWGPDEIQNEGHALGKLLGHCRAALHSKSLRAKPGLLEGIPVASPANLFGTVGRAILPFARSLILMLRACSATVKDRQRRFQNGSEGPPLNSDKILESVLEGYETMTTNDGFLVLKEMQGPLPSSVIGESGPWLSLVDRWLTGVIGLEKHHGSRGQSLIPELVPSESVLVSAGVMKSGTISLGSSASFALPAGAPLPEEDSVSPVPRTHAARSEDSEDGIDDDVTESLDPSLNDATGLMRFFGENHEGGLEDDSDEDLIEEMEMDEAEEMVGFADQVLGPAGFGSARHTPGSNDGEDSADEPSTSGSDGEGDGNDATYVFASVSFSPIVSYQPSLLAIEKIGPGRQGSVFEAGTASAVMADLSHLGLIHRKGTFLLPTGYE